MRLLYSLIGRVSSQKIEAGVTKRSKTSWLVSVIMWPAGVGR